MSVGGSATTIVCIFLVAPETILTESWFFYSQLQILLTALILYALTRFASTRRTTDGVLFAGSLGALVLLRSAIHIGLMVLVLVIVWRQLHLDLRQRRGDRRRPVAARGRVVGEERARLRQLDQQHLGRDEPLVRRERRRDAPGVRATRRRPHRERVGVPHRVPRARGLHGRVSAPDAVRRRGHRPPLQVDGTTELQRVALHRRRLPLPARCDRAPPPRRCDRDHRAELAAYTDWAQPGDDSLQLRKVRAPIATYADWFDRLVLLRPVATGWNDPARFTASAGAFPWGEALGSVSYTILALFGFAIYGAIAGWRRRRWDGVDVRCVCTVAAVLLVTSVVLGNALDYRENNRFRVEAAPFMLVLAALGLEVLLRVGAPIVGGGPRRPRRPQCQQRQRHPDEPQVPPGRRLSAARLSTSTSRTRQNTVRPMPTRATIHRTTASRRRRATSAHEPNPRAGR